jgi:Protein of unknown function (DUF3352)
VKRALVACALAVALVASGCGSQTGSGATDPAKLAPAGTLAYASLELAPRGSEKRDFDTALAKLLGRDPETALARGLIDAIKEKVSPLDYAQDVKPWLGDTAAVALTSVAGHRPDFVLLLASTDDDKARAAIEKDLSGRGAQPRSYRGNDYRLLDDGTANGVVDHFLVAGTERAFKAVVDTGKDGKSLADSQAWRDSVGDPAQGKVGLGFLDLKAFIQDALAHVGGAQRLLAPLALGFVQLHPFVATLTAQPDAFVLDVSSPGTPADKRGPLAASSPLIETLPGDSWLALALPRVGAVLEKVVAALKLSPLIGAQYARIARELRRSSGLDIERDILAGISDVGVFARGSSMHDLNAGLVVAAGNRAALRRTIARLPRLLARQRGLSVRSRRGGFNVADRSMSRPIQVRSTAPGAVAVYGSPRAAIAPATRLGRSADFGKAAATLGARPTLFVAFPPLFDFVRHEDHHALTPEESARLSHLDYAGAGVRRDGGLDVIRVVLGLH